MGSGTVMSSSNWSARNAPDTVLERHLKRNHGKKKSWVDENRDDLRSAHRQEHKFRRADHDLDEYLTY